MHSTVTFYNYTRLSSISIKTKNDLTHINMRTLDRNTLTEKPKNSIGFAWNSKRRFR